MKKFLLLLCSMLYLNTVSASRLTALFSYCSFDVPGGKPYVELYLYVVGTTVKFVPLDSLKKGQIEVEWKIRKSDSVIFVDKYNLNSPSLALKDSMIPDFLDQQRVEMLNGSYEIELTLHDKNTNDAAVSMKQQIKVEYPADTVSISDIELLENYTKTVVDNKSSKAGFDLTPAADRFFPKERNFLKFYAEIYRTNKVPADDYLVKYYFTRTEDNKILSNYSFNLRQKAANTNVVMSEIPIEKLPSGTYNLNIEIRNKQNQMIAFKSATFKRSNPESSADIATSIAAVDITNTFVFNITSVDSLVELIDVLHPISSPSEFDANNYMIEQKDVPNMQRYLYFFWKKRSPEDPESAFNSYMKEVQKANRAFAAMGHKGYATDRGRVYLQYGPPSAVSEEKYPAGAYPYEIWQYYQLKDQTNRKFVFYCPEISSENYELIHSDARGELQNNQWEFIIHDVPKGEYGIDDEFNKTKSDNSYGTHSNEKFNNPH
jgi:GWxTD domain-containing protein